jgi:hypothetical protein
MLNAKLVATRPGGCTLRHVSRRFFAALLMLGAASCTTPSTRDQPTPSITAEPRTKADIWREIATDADEGRLEKLGLAWQEALREAQPAFRREIEAEGALLRPRAALARPAPTPGSYYCRLIKLGKATAKAAAFEKFKPFFCYVEVEDDLLTIVKQTGSQRPAGRLWEDDRPDRLVFLGSLALADEQQPKAYAEDPERDMAGVLERVEPFRWRLVIPWPQSTSKLDVFELTPVEKQPGA